MKILFTAAECAPFAKVGGLGDVIGALPRALVSLGHDVRVVLPHHGSIDDDYFSIKPVRRFTLNWNAEMVSTVVSGVELEGVQHYFIRGYPYFALKENFIYHQDEGIDLGRFVYLAGTLFELVQMWEREENWVPDVVHAHDWHTAVVPYMLETVYKDHPVFSDMPSVFSVHNLRYQGWGVGWHLKRAGLPPVDHGMLHAIDRTENAMAVGLAYATMLNTVSPTYAREIMSPDGGFGLDSLLSARSSRMVGIVNGIDAARWNPACSEVIRKRFTANSLTDRVQNKLALQSEVGLPQGASIPLIGVVTRLVEQKGPEILAAAMRNILSRHDAQFVLLGSGQHEYENDFWQLANEFPTRAAIRLTFDEALSERIYAGSDMFVMPSLFEPCGLGQMIAMRYGAIPVVREVGGLLDTVRPDTGFLFHDFHPAALEWVLGEAIGMYISESGAWRERQKRAMEIDFSWENSARKYVELYQQSGDYSHMYT